MYCCSDGHGIAAWIAWYWVCPVLVGSHNVETTAIFVRRAMTKHTMKYSCNKG